LLNRKVGWLDLQDHYCPGLMALWRGALIRWRPHLAHCLKKYWRAFCADRASCAATADIGYRGRRIIFGRLLPRLGGR